MTKTIVIGYSAHSNSLKDYPGLYFKPSPSELPPQAQLACELMTPVEERHLLLCIDSLIMDMHRFLPQGTFSWQGIDLSPVMLLDFQSLLAEWVLFALAIKKFLEDQAPDNVVIEETADRPWLYDLVTSYLSKNISVERKSAPFKEVISRTLAPKVTKWRGLPALGREIPGKVDYLILLQNSFTDLANLYPLIKAMGKKESFVIAIDPDAISACEKMEIRFGLPGDFGQPKKKEEKKFCRAVKPKLLTAPIPQNWQVEGSLSLPLRTLFLKYFPYLPAKYLFQLHRFYESAHRALTQLKPKLVIQAQDVMRAGSAYALAAEKLNVPSVCIQHGITGTFDHGFLPVHATKLATWGKWSREYLSSRGGDPEKLEACGCTYIQPLIDSYVNQVTNPPLETQNISIFTNPSGMAHHRQILQSLASIRSLFPKYRFLVKVHPAERDYTYRKFINQNTGLELWDQGSTLDLIKKSALVIVFSSGVGLEALLLKKPVIVVNFSGHDDILGVGAYGAVPYVTDPTKLGDVIKLTLDAQFYSNYQERIDEYLRLYFNNFSSDPVDAILGLGEELIQKYAPA